MLVTDLGRELREARIAHGLSQAEVGRAARLSAATVSRIEHGLRPRVPLIHLAKLSGAVGMELSARAYPAGAPIRDAAHLALLARLRAHLAPTLIWRTEVPLPHPGDPRSWDAGLTGEGFRLGIEAETRGRDAQELERRLSLKQRDGGVDSVILLLADTRSNRMFVKQAWPEPNQRFPVPGRVALRALAAGRAPGGDTIILL